MKKPLRCYLSMHSWRQKSTADGSSRFRKCRRCGKEEVAPDPPHWSAAGGAG